MSRFAAVVALLVLVGCADVAAEPKFEAIQRASVLDESGPDGRPELLVTDWPLRYDVSSLSHAQWDDVQVAMDTINVAVGFEALAIDTPDPSAGEWSYGRIHAEDYGCDLEDRHAGFSSWNLVVGRASVCVEWKSDQRRTVAIITHELLHTLGIGHDADAESIMSTPHGYDILPHHIAHIRKLAGLE